MCWIAVDKMDLLFTNIFTWVKNASTSVLTSGCASSSEWDQELNPQGDSGASSSVIAVLHLLNNALNEIPDLGEAKFDVRVYACICVSES